MFVGRVALICYVLHLPSPLCNQRFKKFVVFLALNTARKILPLDYK